MKLVASVRLLPEPEQATLLRDTLERCNAACDWLAALAIETKTRRQYDLHKLGYADMRANFGLAAQVAVRCVAKVADSLKAGDKKTQRTFHRHAAQPYDERIFRFLPNIDAISIWTLAGRQIVPFACGTRQRELLKVAKGQVDLMFVRGKWMLSATCDLVETPLIGADDAIGIDMGIVNLAVDDLGKSHSGAEIEDVRRRQHSRCRALQKVGTRSAKRALRRASGKQARFQRHTNHVLSKTIVADAERGRCLIALEDLGGIRNRVKAKRHQRARMANWGFAELRELICYKAALKGVAVVLIDPRNTSRQCSCCSLIDKRNRPNRDDFLCIGCGFAAPADTNAARNIRQRGLRARSFVVALQGTRVNLSSKESRLL
ncbi:MAG: RNA-guided endonuclease TnpB family protein [Steroidobacteraceae bacterium]